jgi:phospholipid/cholesterol/gamma-HCH transport system ATP-binding protein
MREDILVIKGLKKSFGKKEVLRKVNLIVKEGKIVSILGKSGCGKTTLLKIIAGLLSPQEGEIIFEDENIISATPEKKNILRRKISMVFQHNALFDSLDVRGNVGFFLREHTNLDEEDIMVLVKEVLEKVGLLGTEDLGVAELSGGMRKRVAIARAIITHPRLILYDEPTVGIDPKTVTSIINLMRQLPQISSSPLTSLVVTQDIGCALGVADEIALLHEGEIVMHIPKEEFKSYIGKSPEIKEFLGDGIILGVI